MSNFVPKADEHIYSGKKKRGRRIFENSKLQALLDEDNSQTKAQLADRLNLNIRTIDVHLKKWE